MSISLLSIYHQLPYGLRVIAASFRGYSLNWWRYNFQTEKLVAEAISREQWDKNQWDQWQNQRLAYILHRAATQVPYYKKYWEERRRKGDNSSWEILENWPILEKEQLRVQSKMFIAEDCNPKKMFEEHTSGTTGKPLTLWWSHQTVLNWYALFEARVRVWHDVSRFDRWGIIGGQLVTPVSANKPPFWVWNYGLNQLYLSAYHIKSSTVKDYIDAIKKYRIQYLFGYASALEALAMLILEQNIDVPFKLKVVITNAEPLYQHQRQLISSAFGCAVRSTYGMSEIVTTASECSCGTMHLWPEVGIVETIQSDSTKEPAFGECGRLVCTGLFNQDMPLIRYDTGDLGAVSLDKRACGCGRSLPWLKKIEGRSDDVIITPDGRRVGRLDPVFKANFPIREAQVIQESLSCIRILYVPSGGFKKQDEMAIIKSVQNRVGDMEILMEAVNDIPRGSNGKFRAVISKLKRDSAESEMR